MTILYKVSTKQLSLQGTCVHDVCAEISFIFLSQFFSSIVILW